MEHERDTRETAQLGPQRFADRFAPPPQPRQGLVDVISGIHSHSLPLAGMSVARVRAEFGDRIHADPAAVAVVDGEAVTEEFVLREGQVLNFVRAAGERGARRGRGGRRCPID